MSTPRPSHPLRHIPLDVGVRSLHAVAALLILSGVIHAFIWLVDGSSLAGPVSWRKPILFGISAGVTCCSLGWVLQLLPRTFLGELLGVVAAISLLFEVGLITLQAWRGKPAHFYANTSLDELILMATGLLITVASLIIFEFTRRCFGPLTASPEMKVAIRTGMALLSLSCLLGFAIAIYGDLRVQAGAAPELFGRAGVTKFVHGMALHAIQWLPVTAWSLRRLACNGRWSYAGVWSSAAGFGLLTLYSSIQTLGGRARFDASFPALVVLGFGLACLSVPWLLAVGWRVIARPPRMLRGPIPRRS